jgi:hypothetical protein
MNAIASDSRDDRLGPWVWLFPATYLVHLAEESWCGEGFPAWISRVGGVQYSPAEFVSLNRVCWIAMAVATVLIARVRSLRWLLTSLGTVVLINGLAHAVGTIATASYSPGLFSGLLAWVPLGGYTLLRAWREASGRVFAAAVLAGVVIHAVIAFLAFAR